MTRVLVVAATVAEIEPLLKTFGLQTNEARELRSVRNKGLELSAFITGAGMVSTAFEMGRLHGNSFDLAVNAGLAGSFNRFGPGDVVSVPTDCFSELGAEDDRKFLTIDQLGLGAQHVIIEKPFENAFTKKIPETSGITVNTVHGNEKSIASVVEHYQPFVESMEGAAFIHAVNAFGWPALQLRAISNKVERRDRENWKIELAIENLNRTLSELIKSL